MVNRKRMMLLVVLLFVGKLLMGMLPTRKTRSRVLPRY